MICAVIGLLIHRRGRRRIAELLRHLPSLLTMPPEHDRPKQPQTRRGRLLGVDLFSGAGGMSLGATLAGVDVVAAIEADIHAATTFRLNHPNTLVLNERIELVTELPCDRKS